MALPAFFFTLLQSPGEAQADEVVIDQPGARTPYVFEAEPHVLIEPFGVPALPGGGFRGTIELLENGFIPPINNSVGIGFGADITPETLRIPVVLQWNFFLSNRWSVFGEPGAAIVIYDNRRDPSAIDYFAFYAGGRWHFSDRVTLTMRVGRPAFSLGFSFLL
jgi:hypothetical protein